MTRRIQTTRSTMARGLVTAALLCLLCLPLFAEAAISIDHLSSFYLPYQYNPVQYGYDTGVVEKASYDKTGQYILYVVGRDLLHVLNFTDPRSTNVVFNTKYPQGEVTDVATCSCYVAVSVDNKQSPLEGRVFVYRTFNAATGGMELLHDITVGALPDQLSFTRDCQYLVVAIEGELRVVNGNPVDPEGGVDIIHFPNGIDQPYTRRTTDFKAFNQRADEYIARGVRKVFGNAGDPMTTTLSQDLEPEYIAIGSDDRTAYVVLQENNAMAVVNIADAVVQEIYPLGFKRWASSGQGLDGSDRDGAISLNDWEIYGIYQPDTIKLLTVNNVDYIVVANEGDIKEYETQFSSPWTESKRGKRFTLDEINESVDLLLVNALSEVESLGRLKLSKIDGRSTDNTYTQFYTYGGRSFGIYRASDMQLVYESRDDIEQSVARKYGTVFNTNCRDADETPESRFDTRSDDKGPETEVVEIGQLGHKKVIFVGHERPGMMSIYSLQQGSLTPQEENVYYFGGYGDTWGSLYNQRIARDLEIEDIKFKADGPPSINGQAMIAVMGTVSGTVSFYTVNDAVLHNVNPPSSRSPELSSSLILMVIASVFRFFM